jgi:hypothetical protein
MPHQGVLHVNILILVPLPSRSYRHLLLRGVCSLLRIANDPQAWCCAPKGLRWDVTGTEIARAYIGLGKVH